MSLFWSFQPGHTEWNASMLGLPGDHRIGWTPFARPSTVPSYSGAMVDQTAYPVLFGTTQASWAPMDLRFELLTGAVDPDRIARVYVVPFNGAACVVVGFEHGDWGPVGGGREPDESIRAALERELAEEAGGRLLTYTPFAVLQCHSRLPAPYRPHEPHPDYGCLYGYGEVELVGLPQLCDGPERAVAVEVLAPDAAVSLLAARGRTWEADLYRLAANRRAVDLKPS